MRKVKCPNCERMFASKNDAFNHIKAKHRSKGIAPFRAENQDDYEPSFAERAIEAQIDISCGFGSDDEWLLA